MDLILTANATPDNVLDTKVVLGEITFEVDLIKESIKNYLEKYNGLVIEEKDIKEIKSEIAFLRKQKTAINKNRIDLSKKFDEPLVKFKNDVDSVLEVIEETISSLNEQLDIFEEKRKADKKQKVENMMEIIKKLRHTDDEFEFYFNPSYLNATMKEKAIKEDLLEQVNQYEAMKLLEKEMEEKTKLKKELLENTLIKLNKNNNFVEPMKYTEYENLLEDIEIDSLEEYLYDQAKERAKIKEADEIIDDVTVDDNTNKEIKENKNINTKMITLNLTLTEEQQNELEEYLKYKGIEYFIVNNFKKNNEIDEEIEINA